MKKNECLIYLNASIIEFMKDKQSSISHKILSKAAMLKMETEKLRSYLSLLSVSMRNYKFMTR